MHVKRWYSTKALPREGGKPSTSMAGILARAVPTKTNDRLASRMSPIALEQR